MSAGSGSSRGERVLALWCPDWPAVAAAAEADLSPQQPIAVLAANRVVACSATAREVGVRRGMRKRQAQSVCPEMTTVTADAHRDGRFFEPIVAAVAEQVPSCEVLRPGLLVLTASRALRHYGNGGDRSGRTSQERREEALGEELVDRVSACGTESQVGIADGLFAAVLAARAGRRIAPGGDRAYLATRPVAELAVEPSVCGADRFELVELLRRLGMVTIGDFADLSSTQVSSRFDAEAIAAHRQARALAQRAPSGRVAPTDLMVEYTCDPPLERVDAAAFLGRRLSELLHQRLLAAAVACPRLTVEAITERGQQHSRTWRCAEPLTPEETADRIRWQLEGWLTGAGRSGASVESRPDSPVALLRLTPAEVVDAGELQYELSGAGLPASTQVSERARRSLARVQGLLGGDAVRVPVRSGGRGPAEQISWVSLGDEAVPERDPSAPWPGRMPQPAPAVIVNAPVAVLDGSGAPVGVSGRGAFSAEPATVHTERVAAGADASRASATQWTVRWWAGPWPDGVDEAGGPNSGGLSARAQVLLDDDRALLLRYHPGDGWAVEGVYE